MKAILIAAGMGTRLRPLTENLPKCLAVAGAGKTLFDTQIQALRGCGIEDLIVVRGYKGEQLSVRMFAISGITILKRIIFLAP